MQHSNCYSNVKSQYNKFEYGGYLIVKMDLVYKWPFSFFFYRNFQPLFPPSYFNPPVVWFYEMFQPPLITTPRLFRIQEYVRNNIFMMPPAIY